MHRHYPLWLIALASPFIVTGWVLWYSLVLLYWLARGTLFLLALPALAISYRRNAKRYAAMRAHPSNHRRVV